MANLVNDSIVDSVAVGQQTLEKIGAVGKWLQAIGIAVVIFVILAIYNWWNNRKKLKVLAKIDKTLGRLERKIDGLS